MSDTEKLERIKNHVNNFQYVWITNSNISDWYGKLQELLKESKEGE